MTALGTGLPVVRTLRAKQFAKTFTTYGKLPEIPIATSEYVVLVAAFLLVVSAVFELVRIRAGAPLAFVASASQWVFYGQALSAYMTGDGVFEPVTRCFTKMPWQHFAWLGATTLCSAVLCWVRFRAKRIAPRAPSRV